MLIKGEKHWNSWEEVPQSNGLSVVQLSWNFFHSACIEEPAGTSLPIQTSLDGGPCQLWLHICAAVKDMRFWGTVPFLGGDRNTCCINLIPIPLPSFLVYPCMIFRDKRQSQGFNFTFLGQFCLGSGDHFSFLSVRNRKIHNQRANAQSWPGDGHLLVIEAVKEYWPWTDGDKYSSKKCKE